MFKDVVEFARKNPKKLTYGTSGTGTSANVAMETIAKREGVQFTIVPFKGSPETQAALLGGHVLLAAGGFGQSLVDAGETRLLLLLAEARSPYFPEVPILKDLGYDIPAPTLFNVVGPRGLPEAIEKKIEDAFTKAMSEPAFIKGMKDLRLTVVYRNSSQLEEYVARNYESMGKLLKQLGFAKQKCLFLFVPVKGYTFRPLNTPDECIEGRDPIGPILRRRFAARRGCFF